MERRPLIKRQLVALLEKAVREGVAAGLMPELASPFIEVELTKDPGHGDYPSNVAMILASQVRKNPREIAVVILQRIEDPEGFLEKVEIAGPGFMNFFIREGVLNRFLADVERGGERYGSSDLGKGGRVQVEFVSANPTGPLHIGHARGAVGGDVMG